MTGFRLLGDPLLAAGWGLLGSSQRQAGFVWNQRATFEGPAKTPNPTAFDALGLADFNMTIIEAAAMQGSYGLSVRASGVGSDAYGSFTQLSNETQVTLEFYFDPTNITLAVGDIYNLVDITSSGPGAVGYSLLHRNLGGVLQLLAQIKDDAGANVFPWIYTLPGRAELIRLEMRVSTAPGANNGIYRIYSDNVFQAESTNLDNDTHDMDEIRIGTVRNLDPGTNGPIYLDDIKWMDQLVSEIR